MKIKKLRDFPLSKLDERFRISPFERKIYPGHVKKIKKAILSGKMLDNVITVCQTGGENQVIDGQHRLQALKALHSEGKLDKFILYMRIVPKVEREAYIDINKGKALSSKDILKAYDDGATPLFNELRSLASHYGSKTKIPYTSMLFGYIYTNGGQPYGVKENIDKYVADIPKTEACKMKDFLEQYRQVFGKNTNWYYYKATILRNFLKIFTQHYNKFHSDNVYAFWKYLKKFRNDKFLYENQSLRSVEGFEQLYYYMETKAQRYFNE